MFKPELRAGGCEQLSAKRTIRLLVLVISMLLFLSSSAAWCQIRDVPPPTASSSVDNRVSAGEIQKAREFSRQRDSTDDVPLVSWQSIALSIIVLIFGTYVITLQYRLLLAAKSQPADALRGLTVTTIVVLSLAIISSGFGRDQITPVMGLFGTIIGYLLGATNRLSGERQDAAAATSTAPVPNEDDKK